MLNEVKDEEEKKKLIKYTAEWWAGQIMLMKAAHMSRAEENPISKRLAEVAKKEVTDESLGKFISYFTEHADDNRNACKMRLDIDYHPNCLFLQECFDYAGIDDFFFAPKKTQTSLNIEQGFFAYRMEEDKDWTIRAKTKYCDTNFGDYFNTYKLCLFKLED